MLALPCLTRPKADPQLYQLGTEVGHIKYEDITPQGYRWKNREMYQNFLGTKTDVQIPQK